MQRRRDAAGLSAHYDAFLRETQKRHPRLRVIDARHSGFPDSVFADLTHLNRDGAVAYSSLLGKHIATLLNRHDRAPQDRWVALADYQGVPFTTALVEDLTQSAEALRQAAKAPSRVRR
jgi:hypothetical protein